tara:strand:+ start:381 stop:758 length:378 start_codon:yes stop_codon:yes gene_type:complete
MWVSIFGFILYQRYASNTVLILCGCVMTLFFYSDNKVVDTQTIYENDKNILVWLESLTSAKEQNEIDRCFNEVQNILHSDSMTENKLNHEFISTIVDKYKPQIPLASNIDPADPYSIAVGFTKCQ